MISLTLVQRGTFQLAPQAIAPPLPSPAPKVDQVYRGPVFAEPVPVRVVQAPMAGDPAVQATTAKSRPRSAPTTHKPKHKGAHQVVDFAPKAPNSPAEICVGLEGMDLARCMRPQILDADLQLRTAYNEAAKGGVKRRELVAYRRQWSKLRKKANSDPRGVLVGFREMALQLDSAHAGSRSADSERMLSRDADTLSDGQ